MTDAERVAVTALGGVVLSAVLSAFIAAVVSRRSIYINSVTAERSKWIEKLRSNLSEFVGHCRFLAGMMAWDADFLMGDEYQKANREIGRLSALITLQLNPEGNVDRHLISLLEQCSVLANRGDRRFEEAERLIARHSQYLLKGEWEKVKFEASGLLRRSLVLLSRYRRSRRYAAFAKGVGQVPEWLANSN